MTVTINIVVFCRHCDNEKMTEVTEHPHSIVNSQTFECPKCHHRVLVEQ